MSVARTTATHRDSNTNLSDAILAEDLLPCLRDLVINVRSIDHDISFRSVILEGFFDDIIAQAAVGQTKDEDFGSP